VAGELLDWIAYRPSWWADAACREHSWREFFPMKEASAAGQRAKAICAGCLVLAECRSWALEKDDPEAPELVGIFGGMTTRERRAMRKAQVA
jgi:WhiB family transcriptional regulator, redox-sensing transcriptional regulator